MSPTTHLLQTIFNHDFARLEKPQDFQHIFFDTALDLEELEQVFAHIQPQTLTIGGRDITSAMTIKGKKSPTAPFCILAQLHGNEPAGLAGILIAMALSEAGLLEEDVVAVIGNPLAAAQYFKARKDAPEARQETRDAFRCGVADDGSLLPDMNRIPTDFQSRPADSHHIKRAQELYHIGQHISGIADIHTARGNMICITDHKRDQDLKFSPIRSLLLDLADAISANASGAVTLQTLKTILAPLPNIGYQVGIEAGRHEEPYAPHVAASFILSALHTLGLTAVKPLHEKENGAFTGYHVKPRITYADLTASGNARPDDEIYMVTECHSADAIPKQSDRVLVKLKDGSYAIQTILENIINPRGELAYAIYQYDEMVHIKKGHVVALAVPSGVTYRTPFDLWGIFFSKSSSLYDKDPAVGPWPLTPDKLASTKFCYPCQLEKLKIAF
ncbi:MAG: hypothetical protein SFW63_01775 [Alphaproteobacteria bacterium]|nr:hypothetical protein [Alphaproteobacteria bacterium]